MKKLRAGALGAMAFLIGFPVAADNSYQPLPYFQDWSQTGMIVTNNDWSAVPGVVGFLGDDLTSAIGVDPRGLLAPGGGSGISVWANQTNPNTFGNGGTAEFHLVNPVLGLQGSGSADAPFLLFHLDTRGWRDVAISYLLRDLDGSADDAVQAVAFQYRVGSTGDFSNVTDGYVADATSGPSLASLVTPVSVVLPEVAWNTAQVQVRVITANAAGSDEWVGIDDFRGSGVAIAAIPEPQESALLLAGVVTIATVARRRIRRR